jgi:magnesium transporter
LEPGAIVDCLLFQGDAVRPLALDDVSDYVGDPSNFIWIELRSPDTQIIDKLGEEFGLHELALEDAVSTQQRTKLEEYGGHLFIAVRTAQQWESRLEIGETHLFAGSNFLIAIRHGTGSSYQRVAERLGRRRPDIAAGAPFALYLALDLIVDQFKPVIESMQDRFQSLESLLIETKHLGRENLERLYALKRQLTALRDAIDPMQELTQDLIRLHPEFATRELRAYYRDVHDHSVRISSAISHLRNSTSDAMQFHLASLSLQQNESVQKLAGWGALLAVPTVVFSLYGMNFSDMPELHWPWAYPALLAATGIVVLRLHRHLKKRGWI